MKERNLVMTNTNLSKEQAGSLVEKAVTSFNTAGFTPVASIFRLSPDQLKTKLLEVCKTFIKDARMVTLDIDNKRGTIGAFLWLPDDSSNIRDTSTMAGNSVVRKAIYRYSPELKQFMDRFSPSDSKRLFAEENSMHLVGLPIMIDRLMFIIFDSNGERYNKEYGLAVKAKTRIRLCATFGRGDEHTYGKLKYVEVRKEINSDLFQREPRAKKSYKY